MPRCWGAIIRGWRLIEGRLLFEEIRYVHVLDQALMTQNSCAVGMRNAILRNRLRNIPQTESIKNVFILK